MSDESVWITAKYDSKCKGCEEPIYEGDRVLWKPDRRIVLCEDCGNEEEEA